MDPNLLLQQLNLAKDTLNRPDFAELKKNDPTERIIRETRRTITETKGGQNVTKAWLKIYELLLSTIRTQDNVGQISSTFTPVTVGQTLLQKDTVTAFLNAEFPGSFLFALNHFVRSNGKKLEWVIASYFPRDSTGKDFLKDDYQLKQKYPDQVLVGRVTTNKGAFWVDGDMTHSKMPEILSQLALSRLKVEGVDLYTADGGFGVEGRENLQEQLSLPLIRGEIETGMRSLRKGGIFVLKHFTFFTVSMFTLLIFLMRHFEAFDLIKPSTSGQLNSELYFVGVGFRGVTPDDLKTLAQDPMNPTTIYAQMSGPETQYLLERLNFFFSRQINAINNFITNPSQNVINTTALIQTVPKLDLSMQL